MAAARTLCEAASPRPAGPPRGRRVDVHRRHLALSRRPNGAIDNHDDERSD
jgi:hypothetical protein